MRFNLILLFVFISCISCNNKTTNPISNQGPFFGIQPTDSPQLLAPELLASPVEEYNGTFSPDGKEFFYTTDIPENAFLCYTKMLEDNSWSKPVAVSFTGEYPDYDPIFSPDGKRLYFSSRRPINDQIISEIWFVEKENGIWANPVHVPINGLNKGKYFSSITNDGKIYFNIWATRKLYVADQINGVYEIIDSTNVNMVDFDKGDPFVSPKEDYLIFRGYGEDSFGNADLYISYNIDGVWSTAINLGEPINSSAKEICPWVSANEKIFTFASNRTSEADIVPSKDFTHIHEKYASYDNGKYNLYFMSGSFIQEMKRAYLQERN